MNESCTAEPSRRPSPFGLAIALLPENHQLIHVDERTPIADALRIMIDNRFSQPFVARSSAKRFKALRQKQGLPGIG